MSDGQTHFRYWMRGLPVALGASAGMGYLHPVLGATNAVGYLMGSFMDGDLDQIGLSSSEGRMMRTLKFIGVLWVMFWMPYAYVLPHRSVWSHFPYLSTAIRLAYLFAPFMVLAIYIDPLGAFIYRLWQYPAFLWGLLGLWNGLSWADTIHYYLDMRHKRHGRR